MFQAVAAVPDGLMAWETLKGRPHDIDLVLTEVDLPSISGFSLLSLVMEHDICKNIPFISMLHRLKSVSKLFFYDFPWIESHVNVSPYGYAVMSSNDSIGMVLKCMLKGAVDFLIKPVRRNELRNLWQHVWRRHCVCYPLASSFSIPLISFLFCVYCSMTKMKLFLVPLSVAGGSRSSKVTPHTAQGGSNF